MTNAKRQRPVVNHTVKLFSIIIFCFAVGVSCHKDSSPTQTNVLQFKWQLNSRTATFPTQPSLNFYEKDTPDDYIEFGKNDTAYSFITAYLPFSIDTASYTTTSSTITFHDSRQYGIVFRHQDGNGVLVDETTVQIISRTDHLLILSFPTVSTIDDNGNITYYQGTMIDSLSR